MTDVDDLENEVALLHSDVSRAANRLEIVHERRLQCRRGCSSCCVDDLSVFPIEANHIRRHHDALLSTGLPHEKGMCAFLDAEGACRIYAERPYVCRTQGLPLRWLEQRSGLPEGRVPSGLTVELRDICPLNDQNTVLDSLEELPSEQCWTIGPFEDRLAALQLVSPGGAERTLLRDLFATK